MVNEAVKGVKEVKKWPTAGRERGREQIEIAHGAVKRAINRGSRSPGTVAIVCACCAQPIWRPACTPGLDAIIGTESPTVRWHQLFGSTAVGRPPSWAAACLHWLPNAGPATAPTGSTVALQRSRSAKQQRVSAAQQELAAIPP